MEKTHERKSSDFGFNELGIKAYRSHKIRLSSDPQQNNTDKKRDT